MLWRGEKSALFCFNLVFWPSLGRPTPLLIKEVKKGGLAQNGGRASKIQSVTPEANTIELASCILSEERGGES